MAYYLLQKRPDGQSKWDDEEGRSYVFAERLPNAKRLCKNDLVMFYRPVKSGTPEDGTVFALARVDSVELGQRSLVTARLTDYVSLGKLVPLRAVGDPRANSQHSFQPVDRAFYWRVLELAGAAEGTL